MSSERYRQLAHAIQSGIAFDKDQRMLDPKHLRVGVDLRAVEHGALCALLIEKGIFTEKEYADKLIEWMEREVKQSEERLSQQFGRKITLG